MNISFGAITPVDFVSLDGKKATSEERNLTTARLNASLGYHTIMFPYENKELKKQFLDKLPDYNLSCTYYKNYILTGKEPFAVQKMDTLLKLNKHKMTEEDYQKKFNENNQIKDDLIQNSKIDKCITIKGKKLPLEDDNDHGIHTLPNYIYGPLLDKGYEIEIEEAQVIPILAN